MSIPPKRNVLNEKSPNHDRRFAPFCTYHPRQEEPKAQRFEDSTWLNAWGWPRLRVDTSSNLDSCVRLLMIRRRDISLMNVWRVRNCHQSPVLSKDARVRRMGFMSDGNGRWSCYASLKGQGLAFCTIGVEKERLLFDQLLLYVNVLCLLILVDVSVWA